ncbi:MAG: glycosyltransferase family 2 protein [Bacteroidales bacterium]|nr:glycosyltransferase family 2 protein [Bacteroidales bacterium]
MGIKFSIIIPLFNKSLYVEKAIQSVLLQTFTDYELIVIDDGSSDNSAEIALKAVDGHSSCRVVKQENAGVSMARNNGVAVSQGNYLCFLDADDWWEPSFLDEMGKLIEAYPDAGIYGTNYTIVNESKRKTRIAPIGLDESFEKGYINYCQVYARTLAMPLWTGAVCIPRPVFEEMKGFPKGIKLGEDFLLWIHIALKHKVVFLNKPLAFYNQDVETANRGIGRLHKPQEHMLWNLTDLEPMESTNQDYKQLVDNLRTYAMMPYYISREYHEDAQSELAKVDWSRQPEKTIREYKQPVSLLRLKYKLMKFGSNIKQKLIGYSNGTET